MSEQRGGKITILGCGTSTGVPVPGCPCEVCNSDNPKNSRLRTSAFLTLSDGEDCARILIDASPDLRAQTLRAGIREIDALLYTHSHADHILGTDDLRAFNIRRETPIPCYGTETTLEAVKKIFHYIFHPDPNYAGGLLAKLDPQTIESGKPFSVLGHTVSPYSLFHGKMEVLGFRIGGLAYATDCNRVPEESIEEIRGAEVLFLDGLRYRSHNTHFTIDQAVEVAQEVKADRTYLIHMTHDIDYEETSRSLPENIFLAYDGLEVEFRL